MRLIDLSKQKFGRLTVLRRDGSQNSDGQAVWLCRCECGKKVRASGQALRRGYQRSCGCYRREHCREVGRSLKAGEEITYSAMHKRLMDNFGSAKDYECVDCGGWANDWSLNHESTSRLAEKVGNTFLRYSVDLYDYQPRCRRCHNLYDGCIPRRAQKAPGSSRRPYLAPGAVLRNPGP